MNDSPRRKKPVRPRRPAGPNARKKRPTAPRKRLTLDTKGPAPPELDLRTLVRLSMGDWAELADLEWPPDSIRRWLEQADIRQVRGLLLTTLHRWHELRRDNN